MENKNELNLVNRLLSLYDNVSHCARELGLQRQHVQLWLRQGYIPFKRGEFIEVKTNGIIKASEVYMDAGKNAK